MNRTLNGALQHREFVIIVVYAAFLMLSPALDLRAEDDVEYHTPLAGEPYKTEMGGKNISVPAKDRDNVRAINLGAAFFTPKVGDDLGLPFGAFYWKRHKGQWRSRAVISLLVNEVDAARDFGNFEILSHLDNDTVPLPTDEIIDGHEIKSTSIITGNFSAGAGIGYRLPVAPFQTDNALRLGLLYVAGYLYTGRVSDTGPRCQAPTLHLCPRVPFARGL